MLEMRNQEMAEECIIFKSNFESKCGEHDQAIANLKAEISMAQTIEQQSLSQLKAVYEEKQSECKDWESKFAEMKRELETKCDRQEIEYERLKSDLDANANQLEGILKEKIEEIKALKAQNQEQVKLLQNRSDQVQELLKKVEEKEKRQADWNAKRKKLAGVMMGIKADLQQSRLNNSNQ
jgi:DNA repair exonuclease SbcCD ATPase subunit